MFRTRAASGIQRFQPDIQNSSSKALLGNIPTFRSLKCVMNNDEYFLEI
jgi:hypothetical protein